MCGHVDNTSMSPKSPSKQLPVYTKLKMFFSKYMFNSCCQSQFTHVHCLFVLEINLKLNLMCVRADLNHNNFPYLLFFIHTYLWTFMKSDVNNSIMAVLNLNENTMTSKFRWSWFTANPQNISEHQMAVFVEFFKCQRPLK